MPRHVTLGIHDGHDASAAVVVDGRIVAAAQEERYSRQKNQAGYPVGAIEAVLAEAGVTRDEVGLVAVAGRSVWAGAAPASSHTRESTLALHAQALEGEVALRSRLHAIAPLRRGRRLAQLRARRAAYRDLFAGAELKLVDHHRCHAAAAYYGMGEMAEPVLVLTADGEGDDLCGSVSVGTAGRLERRAVIPRSESLGGVYEAATYLLGMQPGEHEFKLMGLAPYAEGSRSAAELRARLLALLELDDERHPLTWRRADGVPSLHRPTRMLRDLVGRARFDHVAAAVQGFTEDALVAWVRRCIRATGIRRVATSGGVFMNVKANGRILELPEVDELFVVPTPSDATNAIGAAWDALAQVAGGARTDIEPLGSLYLGDDITDDDVRAAVAGGPWCVTWPDDVEREVARLLAAGEIVGRATGRMEFGARALGNRSLLADPSRHGVVHELNAAVKSRDFWMPFAPATPQEDADRYVRKPVKPRPHASPYMMTAFPAQPDRADVFVAAQHPADRTARLQEVRADWNPSFHRLLRAFEEETGESIVLNTSLNVHGEPMVRTAQDAVAVLASSGLRHLQVGRALVQKGAP